ncbi:MAG TPA: carbohydrate kinase family protein [archaeon]|nr:carbohydrate kinase family protein [archaeon]
MSIDVTAIGDVNVDLLTSPIPRFPKKDMQVLLPNVNLTVGGGAANFAIASSALGLKTRLVGLVGHGIFGDYIIKRIEDFGVQSRIKKTEKEKTGVTFGVQLEDGSRNLFTFIGTNALFSTKDFGLEDLEGKILYIGGYNFLDGLRKDFHRIVKYAKGKGMLVSLDPDVKSGVRFDVKELRKILDFVDLFLLNRKEGEMLTGKKGKEEIVKNLLNFGCKNVILKCGEEGCAVGSRSKIFTVKGIEVRAVNSTGVGDVFNSAFIFNYCKTKGLRKSAIFANAAGALAVTKNGERRFPTEKEVIDFLKKHGK